MQQTAWRLFIILACVFMHESLVNAQQRTIELFHLNPTGPNISILKAALPAADLLRPGESLRATFVVNQLADGDWQPVTGSLSYPEAITLDNPFLMLRPDDVLQNFDVEQGGVVSIKVNFHDFKGDTGSMSLCGYALVYCRPILSHYMVDDRFGRNLRRMGGVMKTPSEHKSTVAFFNKGSNLRNESFLFLRVSSTRPVRVSRKVDFSDVAGIASINVTDLRRLWLSSADLESPSPRIHPLEPAVANQTLYFETAGSVDTVTWIKNSGSFHRLGRGRPLGDPFEFFLSGQGYTNQSLLNLFDFSRFHDVSFLIRLWGQDGERIQGEVTISPTAGVLEADKLLLFEQELWEGNPKKGVVSTLDRAEGILRLELSMRSTSNNCDDECSPPTVQYLLRDSSGGVRDFSSAQLLPAIEPFFNRGENLSQQSFLHLYNHHNRPVQVLVGDVHQDPVESNVIINLPPQSGRLISSASLETGADGLGKSLEFGDTNRQLRLVPLSSHVQVSYRHLIRDTDGTWRNLTPH